AWPCCLCPAGWAARWSTCMASASKVATDAARQRMECVPRRLDAVNTISMASAEKPSRCVAVSQRRQAAQRASAGTRAFSTVHDDGMDARVEATQEQSPDVPPKSPAPTHGLPGQD